HFLLDIAELDCGQPDHDDHQDDGLRGRAAEVAAETSIGIDLVDQRFGRLGGTAKATETLVYKVYADGRLGGDLGGSAAQSVILMIIVIGLTAIQFRYVEKKV